MSRSKVGTPADAAVVLQAGVRVLTRNATGVVLRSDTGASVLDAASDVQIATNGTRAFGVDAHTFFGPVRLNIDRVTTLGANSVGVAVITEARTTATPTLPAGFNPGDIVVQVNAVQTSTDFSSGVDLLSAGAGQVQLTHGSISTAGRNSNGINAFSFERVAIFGSGTVSTSGVQSNGVQASTDFGAPISIRETNVQTTGAEATGILAVGFAGDVDVTVAGNVRSAQYDGVQVISGGFDHPGGGHATLNVLEGASVSGATSAATISAAIRAFVINDGSLSSPAYALRVTGGGATVQNNGIVDGSFTLTQADDRFNNAGTLIVSGNSDFGGGTDILANTGRIQLAAAAAAPPRAAAFAGLERLENGGLIDLRNGRAGDTLVVGNYVGVAGAILGVDLAVNGSQTTADTLKVTSASGKTLVRIASPNDLLNLQPATIVQATTTSASDAFLLENGAGDERPFLLSIIYEPAQFAYQLVSRPGPILYKTSQLVLAGQTVWENGFNDVLSHLAADRSEAPTASGLRLWINGSNEKASYRDRYAGGDVNWVPFSVQATGALVGVDLTSGPFSYGVAAGYFRTDANFSGGGNGAAFNTADVAAYVNARGRIFFGELVGLYAHHDVTSQIDATPDKGRGESWGGSASAGLHFKFGDAFFEPAASVRFIRNRLEGLGPDAPGFDLDRFDTASAGLAFRVGTSLAVLPTVAAQIYVAAKQLRQFGDEIEFSSFGRPYGGANFSRDYTETQIGIQVQSAKNVAGLLEASGRFASGFRAGGVRAGFRLAF